MEEAGEARIREKRYARKWWALAAASIALFMVLLDATVVNISIPSIIRDLHASLAQVEWVLNAYTLTFAALLITFGRLGDMYGRRRLFIAGMIIFGTGSLLCGLSPTVDFLVASRVLQASGSAFMLPATLALTTISFPPEQRGLALGVWGAMSGIAFAVGPTLGGFLTQFDWRYIFFINLPVVVFAIPFTLWAIPRSPHEQRHRTDIVGVVLSVALLTAFNYGMIEGPTLGWSDPLIVALLVSSTVFLVAFVWWERRTPEPLMDLRLFAERTFLAGNVSTAMLLFTMLGVFFLLPLFLQGVLGFDALQAGLALTPMSLAIMVMGPISGWLSDRVGARWLAAGGLACVSLGVYWMSFLTPQTTALTLAPRFVLAGAGMGLVLAPVTSAVMSTAPAGEEGAVSGILATVRQVGVVLGVAVLGAVLRGTIAVEAPIALSSVPGLSPSSSVALAGAVESGGSGIVGGSAAVGPAVLGRVLPETAKAAVVGEVTRESLAEAGGPLRSQVGTATLAAEASQAASEALAGRTSAPSAGDSAALQGFRSEVRADIAARLAQLSAEVRARAEDAFLAAMSVTLRVAAGVTAFGAFVALLMRPVRRRAARGAAA